MSRHMPMQLLLTSLTSRPASLREECLPAIHYLLTYFPGDTTQLDRTHWKKTRYHTRFLVMTKNYANKQLFERTVASKELLEHKFPSQWRKALGADIFYIGSIAEPSWLDSLRHSNTKTYRKFMIQIYKFMRGNLDIIFDLKGYSIQWNS